MRYARTWATWAALDAIVYAASEERDVLPRHLGALGVELSLAVDRARIAPKETAASLAARARDRSKRPAE